MNNDAAEIAAAIRDLANAIRESFGPAKLSPEDLALLASGIQKLEALVKKTHLFATGQNLRQ